MKRILRRGFQNFEIIERQESRPEGTLKEFRDRSTAICFLRGFLRDSFNIMNLRKSLVKGLPYSGRRRLDDHKVLEQIARRLVSGQLRIAVLPVAIPKWSYQETTIEEEEEAETASVPPMEQEKRLDWIDVRITNGPDQPFSCEPYILYLSNGERIEGELDDDGHLHKEGVPAGSFEIEFPGLFELVKMEQGQELGESSRGKPPPLPPTKSPKLVYSEGLIAEDMEEDEDDDETIDLEDIDPEFAALLVEDEADVADDVPVTLDEEEALLFQEPDEIADDDFPEPSEDEEEEEGIHQPEYDVAVFSGQTSKEYHLAAMQCISVRLRQVDGQWLRDPVDYEIRDASGESVTQGTARDGKVFYDGVAMGDYDLVIDKRPLRHHVRTPRIIIRTRVSRLGSH